MNLLEYEAKRLLQESSLPTPMSQLLKRDVDQAGVTLPTVLKSQVPTGGRGKLGGIKVVENSLELASTATSLFTHTIKGFTPTSLLAEERLSITKELYLSMLINREESAIQLIAHAQGGVEVEDNDPDGFLRIALSTPIHSETIGQQLAELFNTPDHTFKLQDLVKNLYDCFIKNDATLIEINPLVITAEGRLVAGDCKMVLDDAAAFRHPQWQFEAQSADTNFVTLDQHGNVATIANGAGLAMATVDAVASSGMTPANFLDIGGGANADSVMRAFRKIMEYSHVQVIVINIFAGITRCDEIARAIIQAKSQIESLPPLCIRLSGTNYEQAAALLEEQGIPLLPTLESCLVAAKEHTA